jgi:hypothetical protein
LLTISNRAIAKSKKIKFTLVTVIYRPVFVAISEPLLKIHHWPSLGARKNLLPYRKKVLQSRKSTVLAGILSLGARKKSSS